MTQLEAIAAALSEELRAPRYRGDPCPVAGHCYVAAEAAYHLLGGRAAGWTPVVLRCADDTHWYLRHLDGRVVDPTAAQFPEPPDYARGRPCGFLTRAPSRRARVVLERVARLAA